VIADLPTSSFSVEALCLGMTREEFINRPIPEECGASPLLAPELLTSQVTARKGPLGVYRDGSLFLPSFPSLFLSFFGATSLPISHLDVALPCGVTHQYFTPYLHIGTLALFLPLFFV